MPIRHSERRQYILFQIACFQADDLGSRKQGNSRKKKASVRAVMPHHVENQSQHRENLLFECFAINNGWKTPRFPLSCYVELKPLQRLRTSKKLEMSCFYQQSDAVRFPSSKAKRHVRFSSLSHVCNTAQLHFAENVRRGSPLPQKKKMRGGEGLRFKKRRNGNSL